MVDQDLMNYFSLQLCLSDLEEQGNIRRGDHPQESLLEVTSTGRSMVTEFLARLPASRRETVDASAAEYRRRFRQQQQTPAETVQLPDGSMCLRLRLLENGRTLMDVLYTLPSGMRMTLVSERWCAVSSQIYCTLTTALLAVQGDISQSLPQSTCISPRKDGEWFLSLSGGSDEAPMVILLSLPTEAIARSCALQWEDCAEEIHELILQSMLDQDR